MKKKYQKTPCWDFLKRPILIFKFRALFFQTPKIATEISKEEQLSKKNKNELTKDIQVLLS